MELIHFQGLNCYHDCVLSIANYFGLPYIRAFVNLWSETDFRYDPYREMYLTKRLIANLGAMGASVRCFDCFSQEDTEKYIALFQQDEFMIVGMDAFYIPWNASYHIFHGPHYFIARNTSSPLLPALDPTYGKKDQEILRQELIAHTFDICQIRRVAKTPLRMDAADEAWQVLRTHTVTRENLLSRINACRTGEAEHAVLLARHIDAMICNRYLYRFFLEHQGFFSDAGRLFSDAYFSRWKMVKNGIYMASLRRDNQRVLDDVREHFCPLMDEEKAIAENIIRYCR